MSKVITLTDKNFKKEVLESEVPVLVDFWAPWCTPCLMMAPVLEEISEELNGKLKVAKLDVENPAHEQLAMMYHIHSIPNMKLFKAGQITQEFIGFRPKKMFQEELLKNL